MILRDTIVATLLVVTTVPGADAMATDARSEMICNDEILEAIRNGDRDTLSGLMERDPELPCRVTPDGVSLLLFALYNGRSEIAAMLREHRRELDLFEAAALGEIQELRHALGDGPAAVDERAPDGFTALHLAAFFGQGGTARVLLAAGADVEASTEQGALRPLHSAAASRQVGIVRILLAAGADPDARQAGGYTALHSAAKHGNLPMAVAILAQGADPGVTSDDGEDALAFAQEAGADRIVKLIQSSTFD